MSGRYYRVSPAFWIDHSWDDDTRLVGLYVLTSPHRTTEGLFRMPLAYARTDLGWPERRFERAFCKLLDSGFIEYDDRASVCLIVNALRWQSPQNPNQVTAAVNAVAALPATPLRDRLFDIASRHAPRFAEGLLERFGKPLTQVSAGGLGQSPSPPTTTPPNPPKGELPTLPEPVKGNRERDRVERDRRAGEFRSALTEFVKGALPQLDPAAAFSLAHTAITHHGLRDPEQVVAFVQRQAGEAAA